MKIYDAFLSLKDFSFYQGLFKRDIDDILILLDSIDTE